METFELNNIKNNEKKIDLESEKKAKINEMKLCKNKKTITLIDIVIILMIIMIIKRYLIDTYLLNNLSDGRGKVINVLKHYYIRYVTKYKINTFLFFLLIFLMMNTKDMLIQNIGVTVLIILIVSFFQEANELLVGASLAAIITYAFIRIKYKIICDRL